MISPTFKNKLFNQNMKINPGQTMPTNHIMKTKNFNKFNKRK